MRYGHAVNMSIPENPGEAEFPVAPWPHRVVIRIKSAAAPQMLLATLPVGGDPCESSSAPGLPSAWKGPALGQASPISADAAALTGYKSQNESLQADGQEDEPQDTGVLMLRGESDPDVEVHKLLGWTFRKDYPTVIGISLPIKDWVGEEFHEIQFWEETREPMGEFQNPAAGVYIWLTERLRERSQMGVARLPQGMPETFTGITVKTYRTGKAGYILFELLDNCASSMEDQPIRVQISYEYGHARVGIGDVYSMMMLATEFWALTQNDWRLYPLESTKRLTDGTIKHETTSDESKFHAGAVYIITSLPARIHEEEGRRTDINNPRDQARLLQYWAWAQQDLSVGLAVSVNGIATEYWFRLTLPLQSEEEEGRVYPGILKSLCLEKLDELSPQIAEVCHRFGADFRY
jgi:hypothetical protein